MPREQRLFLPGLAALELGRSELAFRFVVEPGVFH